MEACKLFVMRLRNWSGVLEVTPNAVISENHEGKKRKIFTSLNCSICLLPFDPVTLDRWPLSLKCGKAICQCCFPSKIIQFLHKCPASNCISSTQYDLALIGLLSNDALTLDHSAGGYYLNKSFPRPDCIGCGKEAGEATVETHLVKSWTFKCGHVLCFRCFSRAELKGDEVSCSACPWDSHLPPELRGIPKNAIQRFMLELDTLTEDYERSTGLIRKCRDCGEEKKLEDFFSCIDCEGKEICGACAYRNHHAHKSIGMIDERVKEVSSRVSESMRLVCETYSNRFLDRHKEVERKMETFRELALAKIESINRLKKYKDVEDLTKECNQMRINYEVLGDIYSAAIVFHQTRLQKMIESLSNDNLERQEKEEKVQDEES